MLLNDQINKSNSGTENTPLFIFTNTIKQTKQKKGKYKCVFKIRKEAIVIIEIDNQKGTIFS